MTKSINDSAFDAQARDDNQPTEDCFAAADAGGRILAFPGVPAAQFSSGAYAVPVFPSWLRRFFADLS